MKHTIRFERYWYILYYNLPRYCPAGFLFNLWFHCFKPITKLTASGWKVPLRTPSPSQHCWRSGMRGCLLYCSEDLRSYYHQNLIENYVFIWNQKVELFFSCALQWQAHHNAIILLAPYFTTIFLSASCPPFLLDTLSSETWHKIWSSG
jgi:hypothetical protein